MLSLPKCGFSSKEYNLRRHFEINQPHLAESDINEKSLKAKSLLANLRSEQNFFKLPGNESATATRVSFKISMKITAAGKSFTEESLLKNACYVQLL